MKTATAVVRMAAGAATLLCIAAGSVYAGGAESPTKRSDAVQVAIVIPAIVRIAALHHPERLAIGEQDIARGYVELDEATSLTLTSNSRAGYSLAAAFDPSLLSRVSVRIQGQQLAFDGEQSSLPVHSARMHDEPLRVSYRLYLHANAVAGTYRWPVALSFGLTA